MFSHRPSTYPRSWREMSLEFKSMFAYHIGMMVMFMAGGLLTVPLEVGVALTLAAVCVFLSLRHRRQVGWRWPGVSVKDVLLALVVIIGGVIFLTAATPMFSPFEPYALPWYLAGGGAGQHGCAVWADVRPRQSGGTATLGQPASVV